MNPMIAECVYLSVVFLLTFLGLICIGSEAQK